MDNLKKFLLRPRYLRAIPSLVVLTTVMAWADLPDLDVSDVPDTRVEVVLAQKISDKSLAVKTAR